MDSLLAPHLAHIDSASRGIASLNFAPPKIFTNAMLRSSNIVSLIRDSDEQERALFTMPDPSHTRPSAEGAPMTSGVLRRNTAVQSVLGGEMIQQLRQGGAGGVSGGIGGIVTNDVDVELLLRGAEKLINVYHIPGASRRIAAFRQRFEELTESIQAHEDLVEAQRSQLDLVNLDMNEREEEEESEQEQDYVTNEMLEQEEEVIRQLEQRAEELSAKFKGLGQKMSSVYRGNS
ncbi:DASH complex subunit Spc34 [Sphaerosporella brunnea]|uniref:DASH complex subunit SPC34 n=1 Tax=Sphaerosporella brunnea TaxID=1250544 RepID=A0A5J5EPQ7_9PEZI|nr:DASH complex subunit Spc34 [Sphaerosporella brunnea]